MTDCVRRGTEEGRAPGGSAKAPAVGDELTLPAMRIGLELEATAADVGGEMSAGVGSAPELSRDRREGRREASDILVCGDAASSSCQSIDLDIAFLNHDVLLSEEAVFAFGRSSWLIVCLTSIAGEQLIWKTRRAWRAGHVGRIAPVDVVETAVRLACDILGGERSWNGTHRPGCLRWRPVERCSRSVGGLRAVGSSGRGCLVLQFWAQLGAEAMVSWA